MGKPIKIKIRKFLNEQDHFEPWVEILDLDALEEEELPREYFCQGRNEHSKDTTYCTLVQHRLTWDCKTEVRAVKITSKWRDERILHTGKRLPRKEFLDMVKWLRKCANRLRDLKANLRNREEKNKAKYADWVGEEEITI